ncbi:MAG TPA: arginine--tRNA ligase [Actinopolymorphaceae bacterium]|jgi:arginyl-tRNA synthetase
MADLPELISARLRPAFASVAESVLRPGTEIDPVLRRSDHADYQADAALALARTLKKAPRAIAEQVLAAADLSGLVSSAEIAGPGFINLTVDDAALAAIVTGMDDDRVGVSLAPAQTVVVDYSGPNVAKEMHVGHLRSTIIGDAVVRVLTFLGHDVIKQNHIGDWGTQFGMLLEHLADQGIDAHTSDFRVGDLNDLYRQAKVAFDADPDFADRARRRVVALQSGDTSTLALWTLLVAESERHFDDVYDRLGVLLTHHDLAGESSYNEMLPEVADELAEKGLLVESDGAMCVFPDGFTGREGGPLPLIVRKRDGGYGYAITDLAAIRHRFLDLDADRALYVIDNGQHLHLSMVYASSRDAGWTQNAEQAVHLGFGLVLGADRKRLRSRSGDTVRLVDLLDEAVKRAEAVVSERSRDLDAAEMADVAQAVGIGAIKYADLSNDRNRDYVLDFDQMLAMDGNTGPYLQYAHARIQSLFRRAGEDVAAGSMAAPILLTEPAEHRLALRLGEFEGVVHRTGTDLELHKIAGYLHGLASDFTGFYETCPVLKGTDDATRASRLRLAGLTAKVLRTGLGLLGLQAPARM